MFFDFQDWYMQKKTGEIIVDFSGEISPEIISNTLESMEQHFNKLDIITSIKKKIFNVVVECFQNLYHHSDTPHEDIGLGNAGRFGVLVICKEGTFYRISVGNYIKNEKQLMLKDRIDQLNSLSDDEIKTLYRDILSNDEYSIKGGGGLGMLDIVRKTGNKLDYQFYSTGSGHMFFSMDVYIS
jgi:hypothetical protein